MGLSLHRDQCSRAIPYLGLLGLYLTARGYRSYEGDQAYRLPLLLRRLDPTKYVDDPFVRAFDAFNPHVVYVELLASLTRWLGLDATLLVLWLCAFGLMAVGIARLARSGGSAMEAGPIGVGLVLLARGGNIGTNHLFEPILLDRLLVMGLGWVAMAASVAAPARRPWWPALLLGAGALIHPSLGMLLIGLLGAAWLAWALVDRPGAGVTLRGLGWLGIAALPALWIHGGGRDVLLAGLDPEEFRLLSFEVQGPQHMIPHHWRFPQWLAWGCYPVLAFTAWRNDPSRGEPARRRLGVLLVTCLLIVAGAWVGVEGIRSTALTVLQPFRLATIARGLCLCMLARHLVELWRTGEVIRRMRALMLAAGLCGDWALVVATLVESGFLTISSGQLLRSPVWRIAPAILGLGGLAFLVRHDLERGYLPLAIGASAGLMAGVLRVRWTEARLLRWAAMAWLIPAGAFLLGQVETPVGRSLVERCRFVKRPTDDVERLAVWCREHTSPNARFIGPPGPKAFRLWSERAVAFNRAASPYHASGLAAWAERFKRHVGFRGTTEAFARAYLRDRHGLEARFDRLAAADLAELARTEGADHLLIGQLPAGGEMDWELLRREGRFGVYRVRGGLEARAGSRSATATRLSLSQPVPDANDRSRRR